ncbi:alpha-glucosidase/alpha-galactosidase [Ruficoccus sp. ZRK36]|uniref:alpha-glucosidase/alpha-galactosidase n=1 Tax=Ruficoccus sp. ZRK36 TaxID=2866311 RepID=UPI001C72A2A8|nr:alpha-glucosidase/alpha-galactosidase [Ruficoccus sp. ZRK36]QYY35819.1 alpha-glucosidase/alpha-galactosidase [Ruficoccus sp. ZRK36]
MPCKITLIGAGSVVFAKTLIGDILRFPELADATICLMDIDPARLKVADVMMKRIAQKLGVPARIESTMDQREAVRDANYVICTIQVGGFKPGTVTDFEIPAKYGLKQTIADTLGVGGVFRALRTIPVINGIARDIADVGRPGCLLLNYTNPMAMNCWAVEEAVGIPHVGLCHSVFGTANLLSRFAKLPAEDVNYLVAGINHMAFFLKFQYKGQDAYPLLYKALEDPERRHELVRFEMMRRTGYFVTESSEHQSEYVPYFIKHGEEMIERFSIPINEYIRRCEAIVSTWKETEANLLGKDGDIEIKPQSHEYGSYIIHSLESGQPRTVYGNIPNKGTIANLPDRCNVEVPCLVDGTGLHPVKVGALPPQLAAICMSNINVQELTVKAALTGKREHIYHAVMMDPNAASTLSLDNIWAMCDEMIEEHQQNGLLGEFSPVLKNTGRGFTGIGDRVIARLDAKGAFATAEGGVNTLSLSIENPTDEPFEVAFTLRPQDARMRLNGDENVSLTIPAQSTETAEFTTENVEPINEPYRVALKNDDLQVLAIGAYLQPRVMLENDEDGCAHFAMKLSGFDAVEGSLAKDGDNLRVSIKVHDSDIKECLDHRKNGSYVRLLFADPAHSDRIEEAVLRPGYDGGDPVLLDGASKTIEGASVTQRTTPMYYEADLTLPLVGLNLDPSLDGLLFDCICNLGALGDAHSGGQTSLGGKVEWNPTSGHFAWAQLASATAGAPA